jgi:hypothetical protein
MRALGGESMKTALAYEKMWEFQKLMLEDIATSKNKGIEDPSQFSLRTNIRTSSAYIEGTIYQLRLVCTAASEDAPQFFSESEILLLKEKSVSLNSKGKVQEKDSFQKPIASVLFLFSLFSRIHNIVFEPNLSDHKWDSFQKFFKVRNDLMHPKSLLDFEIDEKKNKICVEAVVWFNGNLKALYRECEKADLAAKVST